MRDCAEEVLVRLTHILTHSLNSSIFHSFIHCRGYSSLRPHQYDICSALLSGRDAFALMATGSGKSLAFQLPPVLLRDCVSGVGSSSSSMSVNASVNKSAARAWSLVICPLISLAEDQVAELNAIGVPVSKVHVTYSHTHTHAHTYTHIQPDTWIISHSHTLTLSIRILTYVMMYDLGGTSGGIITTVCIPNLTITVIMSMLVFIPLLYCTVSLSVSVQANGEGSSEWTVLCGIHHSRETITLD